MSVKWSLIFFFLQWGQEFRFSSVQQSHIGGQFSAFAKIKKKKKVESNVTELVLHVIFIHKMK